MPSNGQKASGPSASWTPARLTHSHGYGLFSAVVDVSVSVKDGVCMCVWG